MASQLSVSFIIFFFPPSLTFHNLFPFFLGISSLSIILHHFPDIFHLTRISSSYKIRYNQPSVAYSLCTDAIFPIAFQGLVTQMPAAALVEPGDLLNSLTKISAFQEPFSSFSGDYFHLLTDTNACCNFG